MENSAQSTFFQSPDIWNEINRICSLPYNIRVASPYVSSKVKFDWKEGDLLLIALSELNVRKGFVDPFAINEIINKGVKVYTNEYLHAKIFSTDKLAIVCSCNLSEASQKTWLEAGVLVSDKFNLDRIDEFFNENIKESNFIDQERLDYFKSIYNVDIEKFVNRIDELSNDVNVWSVHLINVENQEDGITKKISEAKSKISEIRNFTNYSFQIPICNYIVGDIIIRFKDEVGKRKIYYPARCIEISKIEEDLFLIHLSVRSGYDPIDWAEIENKIPNLNPVSQKINQGSEILEILYYYFNTFN